ncbi:MAG: hypothetical protein M3Q27_14340, partial [Actinomycetota bacterium]|nr:hypothetical protein [Actinomycetota bacterium]
MTAALSVALAALVGLGAHAGPAVCAFAVALVQTVLVVGAPRALDVPGRGGLVTVGLLGAYAADAAVLGVSGQFVLGPLAAVLAAVFLASLVAQLARRDDRERLVDTLTGTVTVAAVAVTGALYVAALRGLDGAGVVAASAAGVALSVPAWVLPVPRPLASVLALAAGAVG